MNRYQASYNLPASDDSDTLVSTPYSVTAESMEEAVRYITANKGAEPYEMSLSELDALVVDTSAYVSFVTTISPEAAETAGAIALPSGTSVIASTTVIFEAVVPDGYTFTKWTKNGVDAGTDLIQEIGITTDGTEIVAVFEAS
ncbi:MAG: hypothetical protein PQJ59_17020 [Spirochaetales bacterium]|nr:hypothetical protein [Spirochaetales bacterium]